MFTGIINFLPCIAILSPLSSIKPAMSIMPCSNEVSLMSASVALLFEKVPPKVVGCAVLANVTPSPPVVENAVLSTFAPLTCFV